MVKTEGLLPIGSVVMLQGGNKRVMITGYCQRNEKTPEKLWDYCALMFPEGNMGPDKTFLFNRDQIEKVFMLGYQDEEQLAFMEKVKGVLKELKGETV